MDEKFAGFLANQLYPDLKNWISSLAKRLVVPVKRTIAKSFSNPEELLSALKTKEVQEGHWITLECKPSTFGPFLRTHFIFPVIGSHTSMRLGPPIAGGDPIMAMLGQITSHLKPVGLYPPIDDDLYQICLYPRDCPAYGMIGLLPEMNDIVPYIPAVCRAAHLTFSNMSCNVRGVIRQVSPDLLVEHGVPIEKWEELRQAGAIWFIDLADEYAEINPLGAAVTTEVWGGLYSSGHIEILDGQVLIAPLVDGMAAAFRSIGIEPHVTQNQAGRQEIMVFGKGLRGILDGPIYSLHMDAELGLAYADHRARFDRATNEFLRTITEVARASSASLGNPNDLDFNYSDSAKSFSILKSLGSDLIADPLALAMRDWHRKRSSVSPRRVAPN
jgi:hypothetical protein